MWTWRLSSRRPALPIRAYQWLDAIALKGDEARIQSASKPRKWKTPLSRKGSTLGASACSVKTTKMENYETEEVVERPLMEELEEERPEHVLEGNRILVKRNMVKVQNRSRDGAGL